MIWNYLKEKKNIQYETRLLCESWDGIDVKDETDAYEIRGKVHEH